MAREIRFAVGSRDDLRSSVWRLWGNKNDLFLAARSTAGLSKISFHSSGICRHAVTSQTPRVPLDKWMRPPRSVQGITPVIDLIVPDFSVDNGFRDTPPPIEKKLELIDAPEEGTKRIVRVFLAAPDFTETDVLNIPRSTPISFHGCVPLLREVAWIVSYSDKLKPTERQYLANLVSKTAVNLKPGSSADDVKHMSMHIYEKTVPPRLIDVQLGPSNIRVEQFDNKQHQNGDFFSERVAVRRRDDVTRRMLNTPPKPRTQKVKKKPS